MTHGAGEARVADAAIAKPDDRAVSGDARAREEAYGSFQRAGNEKKSDNLFPAGNPFDLIYEANGELEKDGKLSDQSRADYAAAIKAADAIDRKAVTDRIQLLEKALDKAFPPAAREKVTRL